MFQFPGFASSTYGFSAGYRLNGGLPHSEIHGSKPARGSPWLIAACNVLHRLSVPRHSPDALITFDPLGAVPRAGEIQPQDKPQLKTREINATETTDPEPERPKTPRPRPVPAARPPSVTLAKTFFTMSQEPKAKSRPKPAPAIPKPSHRIRGTGALNRFPPTKNLVEADGIEPTTSCLQSTRSPN